MSCFGLEESFQVFEHLFHGPEVHGWHGGRGGCGGPGEVEVGKLMKSQWTSDASWIKVSRHDATLLVSRLG